MEQQETNTDVLPDTGNPWLRAHSRLPAEDGRALFLLLKNQDREREKKLKSNPVFKASKRQ